MSTIVEVVPVELRKCAQWVLWRFETRCGDEKPTKVPCQASNPGKHATTIDSSTWATFETAMSTVDIADGIGFVFTETDPFCGVDLDECIVPDGGLHSDAGAILFTLDSYAEVSPSGTGVKAIVRASLNGFPRNRTGKTPWGGVFEVYDRKRFFTITGDLLRGCPSSVEARQVELDQVLEHIFGKPEPPRGTTSSPIDLDDRDLLERAFRARNGEDVKMLFAGAWQGRYSSQSEADLALATRLAFWFGRDADRIDRVFRGSGLMRPKWDRDDYRERTIDAAISATSNVYSPPRSTSSPTSSPPRPEVTSSLVPSLYRGDEDEHPVPDLVPPSSSWLAVDIVARAARPPEPPQILELLYPGLNHLLSGESEAMKTWLALIAAAEELAAGRGVLWIDGDDVGSGALLERLQLLGADTDAIARRFAYVLPDEALDVESRSGVLEVVRSRACRLAVLDGFNPLLVLHGLNPDSGVDVETFYRLIDPIRKAPSAIVLSDNVVKSREARGAWAIGSERKKSKAEVHLGMKGIVPLVRGGTGKARIDVHKDRPGHLTRPSPGILVLSSTGDQCSWRVDPVESRGEEGEFRPTTLMERVSRQLELRGGEVDSRSVIEDAVTGKAVHVRLAIDRLVQEGYATEFEGPRKARGLRLERRFRVDEDDELELALESQL
jgi:hypothetical protein